jgi:FtsZ-binding cell division protein ZapB
MACVNCKTLIELMQREIHELKAKRVHLLKINTTLQEAASKLHSHCSIDWKHKYQQEL